MSDILIYTILFIFTLFLEAIFHTMGLISIAVVICLFLYDNKRSISSVVFIALISLVLDVFYFNMLGTFYLSIIVSIISQQLVKRFLPYGNIVIRTITLIICFALFHLILHLLSSTWGQGTSLPLVWDRLLVLSIFEMLSFSVLYLIVNSFYNRSVSAGGFKV